MSRSGTAGVYRRTDAHIHLFAGGYGGEGAQARRPGVRIDEAALYASLAAEHGIAEALVIGYEGQGWAAGNNRHIAALARRHAWIRPCAYVTAEDLGDTRSIRRLTRQPFVGIALYVFDEAMSAAVSTAPDEVWKRLADQRLLISVNSTGKLWSIWHRVLARHSALRLLASHLGLPPRVRAAPSAAARALKPLSDLAAWPNVYVKLSGLYALSDPSHAYPHVATRPYVMEVLKRFGPRRLLWGSDFSPCLASVSFPQAVASTDLLPVGVRRHVRRNNLQRLLAQVVRGN